MRLSIAAALAIASTAMVSTAWAQDSHAADEGQKIFKRTCFTCHTSEAGKNKIGPSLFGVVGRKSGSAPGFKYSDAMKNANITWDNAELDKYLADPKTTVPGNKMTYAGVKKPDERKEVIAYLDSLK